MENHTKKINIQELKAIEHSWKGARTLKDYVLNAAAKGDRHSAEMQAIEKIYGKQKIAEMLGEYEPILKNDFWAE